MDTLSVRTTSQVQFLDLTGQVRRWLQDQKVSSGVLTLYVPHTTAGITIYENADPDVIRDLTMELNKVIPFDDNYRHLEGNAAAHIKSSIIGASVQVIVDRGDLVLGTWQGIFFAEFDGPRSRKLHLQLTTAV
ncbi:MAG: YjbQ family protein [Candidatus Marinimicrobia bacterium]|nr:YjbQ family protein [Candidatus Neomarinimicrobiota bacterium]MCH7858252.1 YjbQ family protein [Candidatus Neomarinimicrobiota bacterium]